MFKHIRYFDIYKSMWNFLRRVFGGRRKVEIPKKQCRDLEYKARWGVIIAEEKRLKRSRRVCEVDDCNYAIHARHPSDIVYCWHHQCSENGCTNQALDQNRCFSHRIGAEFKCTVCDIRFIRTARPCHINSRIACENCYRLICDIVRASSAYAEKDDTTSIPEIEVSDEE